MNTKYCTIYRQVETLLNQINPAIMFKIFAFSLVVFLMFSCQSKVKTQEAYALKDSLARTYLRLVDSLERFDTNHPSHQELLAYLRDDTAQL